MFVTLAESIRENARKHMKRSGRYASVGNFECADGSAAKAARKFRQANAMELPPLSPELQQLMMHIEMRILDGIQ